MVHDKAYYYRLLYLLAQAMGGTKDTEPGKGEFYDIPGYDKPLKVWEAGKPKYWANGDMGELWKDSQNPGVFTGGASDMYEKILKFIDGGGASRMDPEAARTLARHWLYGEGIDNGEIKRAHDARPAWLTEWMKQKLAPWLGGDGPVALDAPPSARQAALANSMSGNPHLPKPPVYPPANHNRSTPY